MGTDIHIIIQIFIPKLNQWVLVRNLHSNMKTYILSEHVKISIIDTENFDMELTILTPKEFDFKRKTHENCKDMDCYCQHDFNIWFGLNRDYKLFNKITGARYKTEDSMSPRGLPENIYYITKSILVDDEEHNYKSLHPIDLHSHTYLSDNEIDGLDEYNDIKKLLKCVQNNFPDYESRFLITFDN